MAPCIFSSPSFLTTYSQPFDLTKRHVARVEERRIFEPRYLSRIKSKDQQFSLSLSLFLAISLYLKIYIYRERKIDIYWVIRKVILVFFFTTNHISLDREQSNSTNSLLQEILELLLYFVFVSFDCSSETREKHNRARNRTNFSRE